MNTHENISPEFTLRAAVDLGAELRRTAGHVSPDVATWMDAALATGVLPSQRLTGLAPKDYRELVFFNHLCARWAQFGFNTFDITPDLAAALTLTEAPKPPEQGFMQPYPTFVVRLPPGAIPLFLPGEQFWADLLWIHLFKTIHLATGEQAVFLRMMAVGRGIQVWQDRHPGDIFADPESVFGESAFSMPATEGDTVTHRKILHFSANLLAWIESVNALATAGRPKAPPIKKKASKEARMKLEAGEWPHVWYLGREIKLGEELKRLAPEVALGHTSHERKGWKARMRYLVRGHHQRYHVGEGRTETVTKWKEPFWKGPEGAAAWAHIYETPGE